MSSYKQTILTKIEIPKAPVHPSLPFIIDDFSLAMHLGVRCKTLWYCIIGGTFLYHRFTIKKANGKLRHIYNPNNILKYLQHQLDKVILRKLPLLDCVSAYVTGKSCLDSANQHLQKGVLIKLDLSDFFPSHSRTRVRHFFKYTLGYSHFVADLMASLCTVKERLPQKRTIVPQGSPASPQLCNLIAQEALDKPLLAALETIGGWTYTRYADDLVLSHVDDVSHDNVNKIIKLTVGHIHQAKYRVNYSKLRVLRRWHRQKTLGIIVNEHPNIPYDIYRRYRAIIHNCLQQGFTVNAIRYSEEYRDVPEAFASHLQGKINYFMTINPMRATPLMETLKLAITKHKGEDGRLQ